MGSEVSEEKGPGPSLPHGFEDMWHAPSRSPVGGPTGDAWSGGVTSGSYTVATRDVIVVTHNYRLGPFGFLVSPDGGRGNYGLEDQRLALQWVIDNIAAFGGDPTNITM